MYILMFQTSIYTRNSEAPYTPINSVTIGRCANNYTIAISEHMLQIKLIRPCCEMALGRGPDGTKPLPELMLTQIYVIIWRL